MLTGPIFKSNRDSPRANVVKRLVYLDANGRIINKVVSFAVQPVAPQQVDQYMSKTRPVCLCNAICKFASRRAPRNAESYLPYLLLFPLSILTSKDHNESHIIDLLAGLVPVGVGVDEAGFAVFSEFGTLSVFAKPATSCLLADLMI